MEYKLSIQSAFSFIAMILISTIGFVSSIIYLATNHSKFFDDYLIIVCIILVVIFIVSIIVWYLVKQPWDCFKVTEKGIESTNNGIIQWTDIEICSYEYYRFEWIYIKTAKKERYFIFNHSSHNDLKNFYNEIKSKYPGFLRIIVEDYLTNYIYILGIGLPLIVLLFILMYNLAGN